MTDTTNHDSETSDGATASAVPYLRVVRGNPTDEELAAVVSVIAARAQAGTDEPLRRRSMWASRSRQVRPPLAPAPGAWRASSLPR